ncbi:MAG TPA: GlsB/YeaQ/YmgE family stress response membrane protein [Hyphomicrobiaceae bacterium]|nr:GlsB/YeaQ/YmgE family stress response membrane protein [Hyphomicrobiaceae bacterium]
MNVNAQQLAIWALIGIVAGWLASIVVGGGGGVLRYLITGLIGAFVGGFVFQAAGWKLNLGNEWVEQIVIAAIGAIIVVIIARLVV